MYQYNRAENHFLKEEVKGCGLTSVRHDEPFCFCR